MWIAANKEIIIAGYCNREVYSFINEWIITEIWLPYICPAGLYATGYKVASTSPFIKRMHHSLMESFTCSFICSLYKVWFFICMFFFNLTDKVSFIPDFPQTSFLPAIALTVCLSFNFCSSLFEYKKIESIAAMTSKMFNSCRLHHSPET